MRRERGENRQALGPYGVGNQGLLRRRPRGLHRGLRRRPIFRLRHYPTEMPTMPTSASATVYEPSASDPRIVAALAARRRLGAVMRAVDIAGVEALMAADIVVNAPINKVVDRNNIIGRLKAAQISY